MRRAVALFFIVAIASACHRDEPMAGGKPLSHWKEEATQVSLFSFWNSDRDARRRVAFERLTEIGEPAVPALVDLMREHEAPVSGNAFNALANLGPRAASAVPELIEMLDGKETKRLHQAAWILGTIGPAAEPAVPSLEPLLRHPDPRLRQVAALALGQIDGAGRAALEKAHPSGDTVSGAASHPRRRAR